MTSAQSETQQGDVYSTEATDGQIPVQENSADTSAMSYDAGSGETIPAEQGAIDVYPTDQSQPYATDESGQPISTGEYSDSQDLESGGYPPPPPPDPGGVIGGLVKKFLIPLILLVLAIIVIVISVRLLFPAKQQTKAAQLNYWILWEEENAYTPVIQAFNKKYPNITVKLVKQTVKDYRERLENAVLGGQGPDLFRFHNTWVPMYLQKGVLASVPEKYFPAKDFESLYYPVVTKDLKFQNAYYGVPLYFDTLMLYYNKDLLTAAGVNPPTTWEEVRTAAKELTVPNPSGGLRTAGIALGTTNNIEFWSDIVGLMILQNSGSITNPQGASVEDALQFYTKFAQQPDNTWNEQFENSVEAFAGGKVAMIFAPSWMVFQLQQMNPQLKFAVTSVPQLPGVNVSWASYWVEGVNAKSPNQEAAFTFLNFLSQPDNIQHLYAEQAKTRAFGEPYARTDLAAKLSDDPYLKVVTTQGPVAQSGYLSSRTYDNGLNDGIIKYYEIAVTSILHGSSPRSAIETASRGINEVITKFGLSQ